MAERNTRKKQYILNVKSTKRKLIDPTVSLKRLNLTSKRNPTNNLELFQSPNNGSDSAFVKILLKQQHSNSKHAN